MLGIDGTEFIIIAVVALILIGPDDLPRAARTMGGALRDARRLGDQNPDLVIVVLVLSLRFWRLFN
jgi:sec-independent protein translocase protein TatB